MAQLDRAALLPPLLLLLACMPAASAAAAACMPARLLQRSSLMPACPGVCPDACSKISGSEKTVPTSVEFVVSPHLIGSCVSC